MHGRACMVALSEWTDQQLATVLVQARARTRSIRCEKRVPDSQSAVVANGPVAMTARRPQRCMRKAFTPCACEVCLNRFRRTGGVEAGVARREAPCVEIVREAPHLENASQPSGPRRDAFRIPSPRATMATKPTTIYATRRWLARPSAQTPSCWVRSDSQRGGNSPRGGMHSSPVADHRPAPSFISPRMAPPSVWAELQSSGYHRPPAPRRYPRLQPGHVQPSAPAPSITAEVHVPLEASSVPASVRASALESGLVSSIHTSDPFHGRSIEHTREGASADGDKPPQPRLADNVPEEWAAPRKRQMVDVASKFEARHRDYCLKAERALRDVGRLPDSPAKQAVFDVRQFGFQQQPTLTTASSP